MFAMTMQQQKYAVYVTVNFFYNSFFKRRTALISHIKFSLLVKERDLSSQLNNIFGGSRRSILKCE